MILDSAGGRWQQPRHPAQAEAAANDRRVVACFGAAWPDEATRAKLLRVSAATIDRLLAGMRLVAGSGRLRLAEFGSAVRRSVPIRTFNNWGDPKRYPLGEDHGSAG